MSASAESEADARGGFGHRSLAAWWGAGPLGSGRRQQAIFELRKHFRVSRITKGLVDSSAREHCQRSEDVRRGIAVSRDGAWHARQPYHLFELGDVRPFSEFPTGTKVRDP